jgi:hypothetical protein
MTRASPLPKWKDAPGVAALVDEYIAKLGASAGHFADFAVATRRREPPRPGQNPGDDVIWLLWEERDAVEAAKRGELVALVGLVRGPYRDQLQPETVELMIEFMTGVRNPQTGRRKGERKVGRGRMTEEEREARNPLYNAAAEFRVIKRLLREHYYPSEPYSEIRKRALELAAERANVEPERLDDYLGRARGVRRERGQPFLAKHRLGKTDL